MHFEGDHGDQGKSPITGERQMLYLPSKEANRSIRGTTGLSASLLFLGKLWIELSWATFGAQVGEKVDWERTELIYQE